MNTFDMELVTWVFRSIAPLCNRDAKAHPERVMAASLASITGRARAFRPRPCVFVSALACLAACSSHAPRDAGTTETASDATDIVDITSADDATDVAPESAAPVVTCTPPRSRSPISDDITQVLLVTTPSWTDAHGSLARFARTPGAAWTPVGSAIPVAMGSAGLGWGRGLHGQGMPDGCTGPTKSEGDRRSPAGVFALGAVYGDTPDAGSFPYTLITPSLRCPDDPASAYYNEVLDSNAVTADWNSAEVMLRTDGLYRWVVFVDHNTSPRLPRGGSCIFIHVWGGATSTTVGCTSMERTALEDVLAWLQPGHAVEIALPQPVYASVRDLWQIP